MNQMLANMKRLDEVLKSTIRSPITFLPFGGAGFTVDATIGQSDHQQEEMDGVITSWRSVDFIVTAADLKGHEPQRGDRIYSEHTGEKLVYEAATTGGGDHVYRRSDEFGVAFRIHTTPGGRC
jgi:hypothetical protein